MSTWSFRARLGGIYTRPHVYACARGGGGGRPAPVPVPGSGSGPGPGLSLSSGSGSGSLPGLVLFESGLTGMGCEHTRSATRTRPAPLSVPARYPDPNHSSWTANRCDCWVEPLQQFRPNRCNLSLGSNLLAPPGALYKALPSLN